MNTETPSNELEDSTQVSSSNPHQASKKVEVPDSSDLDSDTSSESSSAQEMEVDDDHWAKSVKLFTPVVHRQESKNDSLSTAPQTSEDGSKNEVVNLPESQPSPSEIHIEASIPVIIIRSGPLSQVKCPIDLSAAYKVQYDNSSDDEEEANLWMRCIRHLFFKILIEVKLDLFTKIINTTLVFVNNHSICPKILTSL